jgi:hypothetical protein
MIYYRKVIWHVRSILKLSTNFCHAFDSFIRQRKYFSSAHIARVCVFCYVIRTDVCPLLPLFFCSHIAAVWSLVQVHDATHFFASWHGASFFNTPNDGNTITVNTVKFNLIWDEYCVRIRVRNVKNARIFVVWLRYLSVLKQRSPTIRTSLTTKLTILNPADH